VKNPITVSETTAVRTLVKSVPELWATCSDAESLARHLEAFGEITITRLEAETTVAWEGARASGTVTLEQSGWGTKVTMTAIAEQEQPIADTGPVAEEPLALDDPPVVAEAPAAAAPPVVEEPPIVTERSGVEQTPVPTPRPGFFARLFGRQRSRAAGAVSPSIGSQTPAPALTPAAPVSAEELPPEPTSVEQSPPEPASVRQPSPGPAQAEQPSPEPAQAEQQPSPEQAALDAALDSLGRAHHRPFSQS